VQNSVDPGRAEYNVRWTSTPSYPQVRWTHYWPQAAAHLAVRIWISICPDRQTPLHEALHARHVSYSRVALSGHVEL
jgi:predicted DNA-binding protein (MmcQ/YjbR family)